MKRLYFILASALVIFSVFSCRKTDIQEEGFGYLYVSLEKDESEDLVFKSEPSEDQIFSLTVYNPLDQQVGHVDDYRELGQNPMTLPAGNFSYKAVASSGNNGAAAFGEPFYTGSTDFQISNAQVTNVNISCSLANVKVTASFSDEIKKAFSEYILTVSNGLGVLVFSNISDPVTTDEEGYFSVTDTLFWSLHLKNTDGAVYKTLEGKCAGVKPRQHYNFQFSLGKEDEGVDGAGAVTLIVNDSMIEESFDLILDFDKEKERPSSASNGFDMESGLTLTAGEVAVGKSIVLSAPDGFKNIELTILEPDGSKSEYEIITAARSSELTDRGISYNPAQEGSTSVELSFESFAAKNPMGNYTLSFFMVDLKSSFTEDSLRISVLSDVDVEATSVNPWARFAAVEAKWYPTEQPEGLSFQYRKKSETSWTDYTGTVSADPSSRTYSAEIRGLEPETEYVIRAVTAEDIETKELSFTTEAEGVIHNMSFDDWYQSGKAWYPNLDSSYQVWDSANGGTASLGTVPTTPEESDIAVTGTGKKAAKLTSSTAFGQFAAGNIYTGKFGKATLNPVGATLQWGVPFDSRPLALQGYFKYVPEIVNKGSHNGMSGKTDICQIQIMLADWDAPFDVDTGNQKFVDVNGSDIIAYGSLETDETMASYRKFTIKLDYRDVTRIPKYIVIVAAASRYGDYFTGGVGSTLYLDEFEFVYDPDQLD